MFGFLFVFLFFAVSVLSLILQSSISVLEAGVAAASWLLARLWQAQEKVTGSSHTCSPPVLKHAVFETGMALANSLPVRLCGFVKIPV